MSEPVFESEREVVDRADGTAPGGTSATGRDGDPTELLRERAGRLVLAHPGVHRLEPTLLGAVQGLRRGTSLDGVRLTTQGRVVDLDVNVATRADHQARAAVLELHTQLVDLVAACGYVPGTVEISVLAIEEDATDEV